MTTTAKLDLDVVEAFVRIADLRSFSRTAEALGTTQAAVSLRLKRLEKRLGRRLIERTPRHVRVSVDGTAFLEPARALLAAHERALGGFVDTPQRLSLGISDHVGGRELPALLARLGSYDPGLVTEVRIAASHELMAAFDAGVLDAAILRGQAGRRDGELLSRERLGWFASPGLEYQPGSKLRLATLAEPCGVRDAATRALVAAGIPWTEVFVGGGVMAVGAAVAAGLGVAALAPRAAPLGAIEVGKKFGLPTLPASRVMLYSRVSDPRSRGALRAVVAAFRSGE